MIRAATASPWWRGECPPTSDPGKNNYKFIRANRARNNIQETLKNLGPDTNYSNDMKPPVGPTKEDAPPQDVCKPITDWPLTLGKSINGKAPAPLNYLSKVGSPLAPDRTVSSTAELDAQGAPTGRSISGAITVPLTQQQVNDAAGRKLWLMGGTPNEPLGEATKGFGQDKYAFGALRCAVDALNGDNVEYIAFPSGARHVFCYAFYVTPPEPNGTIIIRKKVAGKTSGEKLLGSPGTFRSTREAPSR